MPTVHLKMLNLISSANGDRPDPGPENRLDSGPENRLEPGPTEQTTIPPPTVGNEDTNNLSEMNTKHD